MNARSYRLLLALSLVQALACGDDSTEPEPQDSGIPDVTGKVDSGTPPADAGQPTDASRPDAGRTFDAGVDSGTRKPDSGVVDSGMPTKDAGSTDPNAPGLSQACTSCQAYYCGHAHIDYTDTEYDLTKQCDTLMGNATSGPKQGTAKSKLCNDLVACGQRTGCSKGGPHECLCGAGVDTSECYMSIMMSSVSQLPGLCRNEYLAAAGTTDWGVLSQLFASTTEISDGNPVKVASALFDCERLFCIEECFGKVCEGAADGTQCGTDPTNDPRACMGGKCPVMPAYPAGPDAGVL